MNNKDYIKNAPSGVRGAWDRLSEHFSLSEFVRSATADKLGIKNEPSNEVIKNLHVLCVEILEPLRKFAKEPLHINSGFRCPALNMAVGGVSTSNHLFGFAADVKCSDWQKCLDWQGFIMLSCDFDECICERHGNSIWLHVSYRNNMPQRYRAFYIDKSVS